MDQSTSGISNQHGVYDERVIVGLAVIDEVPRNHFECESVLIAVASTAPFENTVPVHIRGAAM